jgi:3',5'-cyclic AMP phosphodiesterase CpdA
VPLVPLQSAPLTTETTIVAVHPLEQPPTAQNPSVPPDMTALLASGHGDTTDGPGESVQPLTLDGSTPPAAGPSAKLLARFVHLADIQLADDESPARSAGLDGPGLLNPAYRPQEGHECRILHAAVRTVNAVHKNSPIDFVLLGGDNVDNAQSNEVGWVQSILDGASEVDCDSGADDDPVPGPDNDPKDPFVSEGLRMPWRWVTGNHDILVQGTFPIDLYLDTVTGNYSLNGARDWSQPGAPVVRGEVPADSRRALLDRDALLERVAGSADGHGIDASTLSYGKAYYWFDIEGTPLRIIVLDSAAETGDSEGVIHQSDIDGFVQPALDAATAQGKSVILTSHHISGSLSDGSGLGGELQPDALTPDAFRAFVGGYPRVLLHLAGHSHRHAARGIEPPGGHGYWELQTASLADYPHQMRVIEVWDKDNGYFTIRSIALDYSVDGDEVAAGGRARGVVDYTSAWGPDGSGMMGERNVELWIAKPL